MKRKDQRNICSISRRGFLRGLGAVAAGLIAAGCQPGTTAEPEVTPTYPPQAMATARPRPRVAIAQASNYDVPLLREQIRNLLDGLGGLSDVVKAGDRVAIKVNLTGGTSVKPLPGVSAIESYVTHPEMVRVLGEALRDAGARELFIVEAVYEWNSYIAWGYQDMAKALDAKLIDLNSTQPYNDFAQTPVGEGWFIYKDFTFNHVLEDIDVFVSVTKMKCHWSAGITLAMKNLIGLVPARYYRLEASHNHRSAFHGRNDSEMKARLPRVIIDLNRARPIHFALLDGIKTTEGGEGPWINTMAAVSPGVLIAGKNPVATDTVAAAAMGFDPTTNPPAPPFLRSDNHLNLAHELGLGTNRLDEIEVVGAKIEDVRFPFKAG